MAKTTSLFRYVLGNRFDELPAPLRAMLAGTERRWYRGTASVTRGSNIRSRLLGLAMGLPGKATDAPFSLEVVPGVRREVWVRHFARRRLRTTMRPGGRAGRGRIVERVGAVALTLELSVEGGELVYRTLSARLLGIPLPRALAPTVDAAAAEEDGRLRIESATRAGGIGRLLRYRLSLGPTPVSAAEMAAAQAERRASAREPERTLGAAPRAPEPTRPAPANERTLMAQPAAQPGDPAAAPSSQHAAHPAEPGAATVPIDAAHARTGGDPEHDTPRPAEPDQATVPASPSRRRRSPDAPDEA